MPRLLLAPVLASAAACGSVVFGCSCAEQPASQGGRVAEDPDTEHHDDRGGQLGADPELVTDVDDQCGNQHVEYERDDEHLRVEDSAD